MGYIEEVRAVARAAVSEQVTDAHLLALVRRHRGRLATFDRNIGRPSSPEGALEVIEAA